MKKALFFILFIPCVSNMFSQNLIYQFHGLEGDPAKQNYIKSLSLGEVDDNLMTEVNNYYEANKVEICWNADIAEFEQLLLKLAEQAKVDQEKSAAMIGALTNAVAQGIVESQQRKAEEQQQKAAQEAQWRAERQAALAQNKQKYAEFQAMTNRSVNTSNYQSNTSRNVSQGSYNDLLTSDPNWNTQVQMWVQQYGIEKTREIVKQKRTSDYQQSIESSRNHSQAQSGLQSSQSGQNETIISAVTAARQQIKIKVSSFAGHKRITHYSNGLNSMGKPDWILVTNPASPSKTRVGSIDSMDAEFSYTSEINGMKIYFDL